MYSSGRPIKQGATTMSKEKKPGMAGRSKTPPKGDVRALGTKKPKAGKGKGAGMAEALAALPDAEADVRSMVDAAIGAPENTSAAAEDSACIADAPELQSVHRPEGGTEEAAGIAGISPEGATDRSMQMATIVLTRNDKQRRSTNIVYTSPSVKGSVRFSKSAFPNSEPPAELTIEVADGTLVAPKPPRAAMTPEERKAARAAQPKLTLAEKVARAEKRTADLKAKMEREAAKTAAPTA